MRAGNRSMGDDDHERMQMLHRRIRQHQQRQNSLEGRKKMKEQEMARDYKDQLETSRAQMKAEVRERLAYLQKTRLRAAQRPMMDFSQEHSGSDFEGLSIQPRVNMATYRKQRPARALHKATTGFAGNETDDTHQVALDMHTRINNAISTGHFPQPKEAYPNAAAASDGPMEATGGSMETSGNDQSPSTPMDAAVLAGRTRQVHRNLARRHRLQVMHHVAAEVHQYRQQMAGAFQFTLPPI